MREIQTDPKQPRDEDGTVHPGHDRTGGDLVPAETTRVDSDRVEGRDRPPDRTDRRNSPWLGGG